MPYRSPKTHTHTETDTLSGVYTTQCTSHYSPLSHNDRYLLASHSRPIPLIWTDSAMPTNDLYQLRLLQSTLFHWSTDCYRDSDYNCVVIHQIRVLTLFIRSDSTQQDAIRQFPLAYSFEVLCSVSFFAQKLWSSPWHKVQLTGFLSAYICRTIIKATLDVSDYDLHNRNIYFSYYPCSWSPPFL